MKRKIISIDESKCNGCRLCVDACHEGAIEMVNGKAKLISDIYCDGLGDCLPACPTGAIEIIEREAGAYSQEAVDELLESKKKPTHGHGGGCPGSRQMTIQRDNVERNKEPKEVKSSGSAMSNLTNWPIQMKLINPNAEYLNGANLMVAADCTAFTYAQFNDELKDHILVIACPKLDDNQYNLDKLKMILENNDIKSIKVLRMEVPCCTGIVNAVKKAMLDTGKIVQYNEITIGIDGEVR